MQKKWTHVRISEVTEGMLAIYKQGLQAAYDQGKIILDTRGSVPTADDAIRRLLEGHFRKAERSRNSKRKRAAERRQGFRYEG